MIADRIKVMKTADTGPVSISSCIFERAGPKVRSSNEWQGGDYSQICRIVLGSVVLMEVEVGSEVPNDAESVRLFESGKQGRTRQSS